MQITVVRHLPTDWNKKTWLQGRKDIPISPLTDAAKLQIQKNIEKIKQNGLPDYVLASSLIRTEQTAHAYGYSPEKESLLDELDFGPFEGKPKQLLVETCGSLWYENPKRLVLGEKLEDLETRIVQFIEKYQHFSHVLVFGHGSWIRAFLSYVQVGDINQMNKVSFENNECVTISITQ